MTVERLQGLVGRLLPPTCREHVLGDLQERVSGLAPSEAARRYLREALLTVPVVIWSQVLRAIEPRVISAEVLAVGGSLFLSTYGHSNGPLGTAVLGDWHAVVRLAIPTVMVLSARVLMDAFAAPGPLRPSHHLKQLAATFAVPLLANVIVVQLMPAWALPWRSIAFGLYIGAFLAAGVRFLLKPARPGRQSVTAPLSWATVRAKAHGFEREIRRRTIAGGVIGVGLAAVFSRNLLAAPNDLQRVGAALTILGSLYLVYQLYHHRLHWRAEDDSEDACLRHYRAELDRQRDFHGGSWLWWRLVVFTPGPLLFTAGAMLAHPEQIRTGVMILVVFLVLGILAVPLNLKMARQYAHRRDELETLRRPS